MNDDNTDLIFQHTDSWDEKITLYVKGTAKAPELSFVIHPKNGAKRSVLKRYEKVAALRDALNLWLDKWAEEPPADEPLPPVAEERTVTVEQLNEALDRLREEFVTDLNARNTVLRREMDARDSSTRAHARGLAREEATAAVRSAFGHVSTAVDRDWRTR